MDSFSLENMDELNLEHEIEIEDLVIKIMNLFDNQNIMVAFEALYICGDMLEEIEKEIISRGY